MPTFSRVDRRMFYIGYYISSRECACAYSAVVREMGNVKVGSTLMKNNPEITRKLCQLRPHNRVICGENFLVQPRLTLTLTTDATKTDGLPFQEIEGAQLI